MNYTEMLLCAANQCAPHMVQTLKQALPLSFVTMSLSQDPQLAPLTAACAEHPELVLTPADITAILERPNGHKEFAGGVLLVGGGLEALGAVASLMSGGVDAGGLEFIHTSNCVCPGRLPCQVVTTSDEVKHRSETRLAKCRPLQRPSRGYQSRGRKPCRALHICCGRLPSAAGWSCRRRSRAYCGS